MSLNNGWTGGQYSIFRAIFGAYLFVHFVQLVPWGAEVFSDQGMLSDASASPLIYLFPNVLALWDGPIFVAILLITGSALSLLLIIGLYDRAAAVVLWYILACLFGRNPLISNPSLPYVGWMLLAHACLPSAPYGSLAARGRVDPGSGWRMPRSIYVVAWMLMALGYTYSGYTKLISPSWVDGTAVARILENPLARPNFLREVLLALPPIFLQLATWGGLILEISFAPLALFSRLRPWLWSLMLLLHVSLITLIDFADLSLGMIMLHLFTFNPGWLGQLKSVGQDTIFFDGHCGLCHGFVRFVLAEDSLRNAFRFAPLQSDTFSASIPENKRASLPDSIVLRTADGELLTRSAAVVYILQRLGGFWRLLGALIAWIPESARDWTYDRIAGIRHRLFLRPQDSCPIVPAQLRDRFDL